MDSYSDRPGHRASYRIPDDPIEADQERRRLEILGRLRDRRSAAHLERLGLRSGWNCLDVGSGGGSLARWIATQVAPGGSVLSTDVDARFLRGGPENLEIREHDIVREELPQDRYDLVHARAVLQAIEQREAVLDKLVASARPGGWIVVSDPDWSAFDAQPLPEAFRALHEAMLAFAAHDSGYDRFWGSRLLAAFEARGLLDIDAEGRVMTMHGGSETAEWLILAYERSVPALVAAGRLDERTAQEALHVARRDDFRILGPISLTCSGRRPGGPPP